MRRRSGLAIEPNKLFDELAGFFRRLVGQKILKVDGTLLQKHANLLPELPCDHPRLHVYRRSSDYSLAWVVKACEQIGDSHGCVYEEVTVDVGSLNGQTLESVRADEDFGPFREDFSVAEVEEKRRVFVQKRKEFERARSDLYPFGEHDN